MTTLPTKCRNKKSETQNDNHHEISIARKVKDKQHSVMSIFMEAATIVSSSSCIFALLLIINTCKEEQEAHDAVEDIVEDEEDVHHEYHKDEDVRAEEADNNQDKNDEGWKRHSS